MHQISSTLQTTPPPSYCESRVAEPRLEDYLDHVCAPLVGRVPYDRRQALRAELGEHLDALIEAREELGESHDEAVEQALRQFGDPASLSRQWLDEWNRSLVTTETMWQSARRGICCFIPAGLLALCLVTSFPHNPNPLTVFLVALLIPLVAGFVTGFRSRRWQMLASCAGAGSVTLLCALPTLLLGKDAGETPFVALAVVGFLSWVPLGSAAGELGGWARRRALRRPQPWKARQA